MLVFSILNMIILTKKSPQKEGFFTYECFYSLGKSFKKSKSAGLSPEFFSIF